MTVWWSWQWNISMSRLPDMTSVMVLETSALSGLCRQILRDDFSISTRFKGERLNVFPAVLPVWLFLVRSAWSSAVVGQYDVLPLETGCPVLAAKGEFSSLFSHLAYRTRYNFLLTCWRKEDTVALSTSKPDFSIFISLDFLTVDLGFLLQMIKIVVRSLVSNASFFSYWSPCRSLVWCGSLYFIAQVILCLLNNKTQYLCFSSAALFNTGWFGYPPLWKCWSPVDCQELQYIELLSIWELAEVFQGLYVLCGSECWDL